MPTNRRVAVVVDPDGRLRGFLADQGRGRPPPSSAGSISSSACGRPRQATPLRRSSWAIARRARSRPACRPAIQAGERLVVDQPDLLEPVGESGRHLGRDILGRQLVAPELLPAARPAGELVEQDRAGHRLGVRVGPGRPGRQGAGGGRAAWTPAWSTRPPRPRRRRPSRGGPVRRRPVPRRSHGLRTRRRRSARRAARPRCRRSGRRRASRGSSSPARLAEVGVVARRNARAFSLALAELVALVGVPNRPCGPGQPRRRRRSGRPRG